MTLFADLVADMKKRFTGFLSGIVVLTLALGGCGGSATNADLSELAKQGQDIARSRGCAACHGQDGEGIVAPAWEGLLGTTIALEGGGSVFVDTEYLRRSIVDPEAEIVEGSTIKMPIYELTEDEIVALIAYIEELQ